MACQPAIVGLHVNNGRGREFEICAAAHPDSSTEDARWECVDIKAVRPFEKPVTLDDIKADGRFDDMPLVKSPRLSVQPVTAAQWSAICALGNTKP